MGKFAKMLSNYNATVGDWTVTDHQALPSTTVFQPIASWTCPPQVRAALGYGDLNHPDTCGYLYIILTNGVDAAPVEVLGKVQLFYTNAQGTKMEVIGEWDESMCHGSLTDRRLKLALPEWKHTINPDDRFILAVKPLVTHVAAGANADNLGWAPNTAQQCEIHIPVTIYDNS